MGDRDRPTFLPPEEPPEEPSGPASTPAPPRRSWSVRNPRALAAAVAGVVVLGGGLVWLAANPSHGAPPAFTRLVDVCPMMPATFVQPLGLMSGARPYAPPGGGTVPAEVYAACNWTEGGGAVARGPQRQRRLHIEVRVSLDRKKTTGVAVARRQYTTTLAAAEETAAKRLTVDTGTVEHWPVLSLRGVGDAAFAQYEQSQGDTERAGLGRVVARLRNAVVTVEYSGANYPVGENGLPDHSRASPLDGSTAQQGAAGVAMQLTKALAACLACMN